MKKSVISLALGVVIGLSSTVALSAEKVNIGAPSWTGAQAIAALLQAVVVERIGGEANLVPGNNATIFQGMHQGKGDIDVHPDVWLRGERVPNRIKLLAEWAEQGGGLIMIGGYFSYQGIDGKARWHKTAVENALPVTCISSDDRFEIPEGCIPVVNAAAHPILTGIEGEWPYLLGVNEVHLKTSRGTELVLSLPEDQRSLPLLVTGTYGKGRTVSWTSDMSEHWLPPTFLAWDGYDMLFGNIVAWAAGDL